MTTDNEGNNVTLRWQGMRIIAARDQLREHREAILDIGHVIDHDKQFANVDSSCDAGDNKPETATDGDDLNRPTGGIVSEDEPWMHAHGLGEGAVPG